MCQWQHLLSLPFAAYRKLHVFMRMCDTLLNSNEICLNGSISYPRLELKGGCICFCESAIDWVPIRYVSMAASLIPVVERKGGCTSFSREVPVNGSTSDQATSALWTMQGIAHPGDVSGQTGPLMRSNTSMQTSLAGASLPQITGVQTKQTCMNVKRSEPYKVKK